VQQNLPRYHSAEFVEFQKNLLHKLDKQVINRTWNLPVTLSMQKIPSEWPRGIFYIISYGKCFILTGIR